MALRYPDGYPALTTTFTAPSSCATVPFTYFKTVYVGTPSSSTVTTLVQIWEWSNRPELTSSFDYSCLPPGFNYGPNAYSPGVCADGSTTVTTISTSGENVAICCSKGYTLTDYFQYCASSYTTPVVANAFTYVMDGTSTSTEINLGATVGPGVKIIRAAFLIQPTSTADDTNDRQITASTAVTNDNDILTQLARLEGGHDRIISNGAVIGIITASVITTIGCLLAGFFILRWKRRKRVPPKGGRVPDTLKTVSTLFVPVSVSIIVGIALCLLATHESWQQEIIRRWNSPNAILRIIQVLSFIMRLCASVVTWCLIVNQSWLLMCRGLPMAQFIRFCDITASGGSYLTLWDTFVSNISTFSKLRALMLLLSLALAFASDLTGNAIIASTGIQSVDGWNSVSQDVPFAQVGYFGTNKTSLGGDDQAKALLSSMAYYPHVVAAANDTFTFLPVQAGETGPSSYKGVAYFGSLNVSCQPASLDGTVSVVLYGSGGPNQFSMSGSLKSPFEGTPDTSNVSFRIVDFSIQDQANALSQPILGTWRIPTDDLTSDTAYIATLAITGLNESLVTTRLEDSPASQGPLQINDGSSERFGQTGGSFSIHICRTQIPVDFGLAYLPQIRRRTAPSAACWATDGLCPNITLSDADSAANFIRWDPTELAARLGAAFSDSHTAQRALSPFSDGVTFCRSCNATNLAGQVLSTYVSRTATMQNNETESLASALQTSILHSIAVTYRNELPFLNGRGPAIYTIPAPATLITNSNWIYGTLAYIWLINIICILLHRYCLTVVGADRSGSALTLASVIAQDDQTNLGTMLASKEASWKDKTELREHIDQALADNVVKLGLVGEQQDRFGVGHSTSIISKPRSMRQKIYRPVALEESRECNHDEQQSD